MVFSITIQILNIQVAVVVVVVDKGVTNHYSRRRFNGFDNSNTVTLNVGAVETKRYDDSISIMPL